MALKVNNKIYLGWDDINDLVDKLCEKIITEQPNIDSVFGLKRGGLIPAVMVSHKLDLPWSDVMYPNTLVVDDICDTGNTLTPYKQLNNPIVTIHYKTSASLEPNFWFKLAPQNEWIVYPWEQKDSKTIPDYATKGK